jgi:hypothetical protein
LAIEQIHSPELLFCRTTFSAHSGTGGEKKQILHVRLYASPNPSNTWKTLP